MSINTGMFPDTIITNAGKQMIVESQNGATLKFTRVALGDGVLGDNEDEMELTALKNEKLSVNISSFKDLGTGQFTLTFTIDNSQVEKGFWHREIGIMASVNGGAEKLYAYTNAGSAASFLYNKTTPVQARTVKIDFVVGSAENVEVVVDKSIVYATQNDLSEHDADEDAHAALLNKINNSLVKENNLYHAESTGYGIVSGCEPSIDGLTVTVGAGVIHTADGRRIEVPEQSITLDAADASNPRIDIVEVDKDGALCKVNGTPAATPDAPQSASNCIMLAKITIATAGKTVSLIDMRQWKNRSYNLGIINVKDYGAKGDGVTDDTAAIQKAIDNNLGKTIFFPHGTYIVSDTIYTYRGDSKRSLLHLIDAHIKASNSFPLDEGKFIISIGDASTGDVNNYWDSHTWCGLIGGVIDGSSRAYGGVKYSESSIGKLMDFTVINTCKVGMQIGESSDGVKSTDVYVSRVKLDGINKEESIGLLVYSYDNNIEYLRTAGFPIGIKIIGGGNFFRECHPLYDRNQYNKEIGFEVAGNDTFINNCYSDMFATAIQIETYSTTKIDGFFYTRASSHKKNAVFLKNTVGAVTFYVKNFTIGFVSSDISSKIYDGVRYCQENFTPTSAYGFYDGKIYGKSISSDDLGAYSELAHQIVYQVTDDIDLNNLLATGTYWIENIKASNNTKNHRPADLTPYGIIKVNSLPALKGARFIFAEQEVFNQADLTPTTKYYRSYFGKLSTDGKTLAGNWGAWRKISLA